MRSIFNMKFNNYKNQVFSLVNDLGNTIAMVDLLKDNTPFYVVVAPEYRKKGVMTYMYNEIIKLGIDLKPSNYPCHIAVVKYWTKKGHTYSGLNLDSKSDIYKTYSGFDFKLKENIDE